MIQVDVRKNTYYDSVTLMLISKEIKTIEGVREVLVGMGTALNLELAENLGLSGSDLSAVTANDFFIAADLVDGGLMEAVVDRVDELLTQKKEQAGDQYRPVSLETALKMLPDANLALVSIPGQYAETEVDKLLDADLHVMLFSDNVSIEAERRLKEKAVEKGLLMMGPDCGTAIINGIPLAFANKIRRGPIGIVGASGTGIQEVTTLIDTYGSGVSQVIGTGGRDLKSEIGGLVMIQGLQALMSDDQTEVIVLISKQPAPEVEKRILDIVRQSEKPVVIDFIGGEAELIRAAGAYPCSTLEDAALQAVDLAKGETPGNERAFTLSEEDIEEMIQRAVSVLKPDQKYLRGLFTGGTLANEAMKLLSDSLGGIYSNIPLSEEYRLRDLSKLEGHACLDLGEDMFTVGRPHPMIDPSTRTERLESDIDGSVAVCLFDVVIGYGSHENPAGELAEALQKARGRLAREGKTFVAVASITGTEGDPQGLEASRQSLEDQDVYVLPSNAQAVRFVKVLMKRMEHPERRL